MPLAFSPRFRRAFAAHALVLLAAPLPAAAQRAAFTLDQVKSYPFPTELTAAATGSRIAWAFDERGARNLWVAEGPEFAARRLTDYAVDSQLPLCSPPRTYTTQRPSRDIETPVSSCPSSTA